MQTFLVNLYRRPDRLQGSLERIKKAKLPAPIIWPGIDGQILSPLYKGRFTVGQVGCWFAHMALWQYIITNKIEMAFIMEDDIHFHEKFPALFKKHIDNAPADWEIIYLFWIHGRAAVTPQFNYHSEYFIKPTYPVTTTGYLLTLAGAKKIVAHMSASILSAVDDQLAFQCHQYMKVYAPHNHLIYPHGDSDVS